MAYKFSKVAATISNKQISVEPVAVEAFLGFPFGLRTSVPSSMLAATELAECKNLQVNKGGQLQSRPGTVKLNNTSLGKIIALGQATINTEVVQFAQVSDFSIYSIDAAGDETLVGKADGKADFISYAGYLMVMDGQYLKYVDSANTLKLAWDGGSHGLFDNLSDEVVGAVNYTVAKSDSVAFTTPAWTAGYTIGATQVEVKLGKVGTGGTGNITMSIHLDSDDSVVASGIIEVPASEVALGPGDFYIANMPVTSELLPSTAYYVKLTMTSYSTSDYIIWYTGASSIPLCGVSPGLPPKASHGFIFGRRLWLYGDPGALSRLYFNNYAPFDWTTPDYSGYLSAVDDSKDSFPIGAAIPYFGSVFVYGTKNWPYLLRLSGTEVSDFALEDLKQPVWTNALQVTDVVNDIWALSSVGLSSMTGVQMYGDVRTYSESASIEDQITKYWTASSFTGYYTDQGQLWACLDGKVFVAHTKAPASGENRIQYPWSEYEFPYSVSCFGRWGDLVIGTDEGFIYAPDKNATRDDTTIFDMSLKTKYSISPFQKLDILDGKVLLDSKTGASFEIVAYKNDSAIEAVHTWLLTAALHDDATIDDLGDALINDLNFTFDANTSPLVVRLGFRCFSYQIQLKAINLIGYPVFINGVVIRYRPMED